MIQLVPRQPILRGLSRTHVRQIVGRALVNRDPNRGIAAKMDVDLDGNVRLAIHRSDDVAAKRRALRPGEDVMAVLAETILSIEDRVLMVPFPVRLGEPAPGCCRYILRLT